MEDLIEWIADFIVNLFAGNFIWFIIGIILIAVGTVVLVREDNLTVSIIFISLGIFSVVSQFRRNGRKK